MSNKPKLKAKWCTESEMWFTPHTDKCKEHGELEEYTLNVDND